MKLAVVFNDWSIADEAEKSVLDLSSASIEAISCSYDGGRFSIEINGKSIFETPYCSSDVSVEVSIID